MDTQKPTFLQALAIMACGALMIFFGCLGWLSGFERNGGLFGFLVFAAGFPVFFGGIVVLFRWLNRPNER